MRIVAYLKQSKVAVFLIVLLLIVQAFADLSLPRYTSDLVDVGIQQGGIEEASPSVMQQKKYTSMFVCWPPTKTNSLRNDLILKTMWQFRFKQ